MFFSIKFILSIISTFILLYSNECIYTTTVIFQCLANSISIPQIYNYEPTDYVSKWTRTFYMHPPWRKTILFYKVSLRLLYSSSISLLQSSSFIRVIETCFRTFCLSCNVDNSKTLINPPLAAAMSYRELYLHIRCLWNTPYWFIPIPENGVGEHRNHPIRNWLSSSIIHNCLLYIF